MKNPHPVNRKTAKPVTVVVPPSQQIPTPGREFLLRTPIEGVSYIANAVKNAGYPVRIMDIRGTGRDVREVAGELVKKNGVAAIATYVDSFPFIKELISIIKEKNHSVPVVLGGPLVSSLPRVLMKESKANYAVLGEGEETILELLDFINCGRSDLTDIHGLAFKNNAGEIEYTPHRPEIRDLDNLPEIDLFMWPSVKENRIIPEIGLSSSRGCPQNCHFCYRIFRKVRYFSPDCFGRMLTSLVDTHKTEYAYINDLTFIANRERTVNICWAIARTKIKWSCSTRVENIDKELLNIMYESGCRDIWYGIESVDQNVLNVNNKKIFLGQIEEAVRLTNESGIKVMGNFIVGLLGETKESLDKMIRFIETKEVIPCSIKYLTPFPGSYIYDYALKRGLIKNEADYLYHLARKKVNDENDEIVNCTDLPDEVLRDAFRRIRKIALQRSAEIIKARHGNN